MLHLGFKTFAGGPILARVQFGLALVLLLGGGGPASAQWITQTNALRSGWNAVFLHIDASYATLDQLVGSDLTNPIEEIWYWQPPLPTGQFVDSPQVPTGGGSQWALRY